MGKDNTKQPKKAQRRELPGCLQHMREHTKNKFEHRLLKTDGAAHTSNPVYGILNLDDEDAPAEQVQMTNENYQFAPSRLDPRASMRPGRASHGDVQYRTLAFDPSSPGYPAQTSHRRNITPTEVNTSVPQHWSGLQSPQNSDYALTNAGVPPVYPFSPGSGALIQQPLQYGLDLVSSTQHDPFFPSPIPQQTYWSGQTDTHLYEDYPLQSHFPDLYMNGYPSTSGSQLSHGTAMGVPIPELPFPYHPVVVPDHLMQYAEGSEQVPVYPSFDMVQGPQY